MCPLTLEEITKLEQKAQLGAFSTYDMEVLIPEVEKLEVGQVYLEVGVDKGKSLSIAKMVAKTGVKLCGVDIVLTGELKDYLKDNPDVEFFWMSSKIAAEVWKERAYPKINVLLIDGDHSYAGCKTDIDCWYPHMAQGSVMLFHDCDESSAGVVQAVAEFVNNHSVKEFKLFKRLDKNTSMGLVRL